MASPVSFQGISTGVQTDALVTAIMDQEGAGLTRLQARQTLNQKRTFALTTMRTNLNNLSLSLSALQDKFSARTVTSSDQNSTNVSATASGSAVGSYEISVQALAQRGRISSGLSVQDPSAAIQSSPGTYAIRGTDGVVKTIQPTVNSLTGLRDAINESGAGVTATIVNNGSSTNPYQLVVSSSTSGAGQTGGVVSLVDITAGGPVNQIGIGAGQYLGGVLTGGTTSVTSGQAGADAAFTLNGVQMTRSSNVVTDAIDGVSLTLRQGNQTGVTTLTIGQDKMAVQAGVADVVSKYNTLQKGYKDAATSVKNSDGSINPAPLAGEALSRGSITQIKNALSGFASSQSTMGLRTQADGSLNFDQAAFAAALTKDPAGTQNIIKTFAQSTVDQIGSAASSGGGSVGLALRNIQTQNQTLSAQIDTTQARLDRRRLVLQGQFARIETQIGQMKAAGGSLSGM